MRRDGDGERGSVLCNGDGVEMILRTVALCLLQLAVAQKGACSDLQGRTAAE